MLTDVCRSYGKRAFSNVVRRFVFLKPLLTLAGSQKNLLFLAVGLFCLPFLGITAATLPASPDVNAVLRLEVYLALIGAGVGVLVSPYVVWRFRKSSIGILAGGRCALLLLSIVVGTWVPPMLFLFLIAVTLD